MNFVSIVSGTSTDGLTVADIQLDGYNMNTKFKICSGKTFPFSKKLRSRLLGASEGTVLTAEGMSRLNWDLGNEIVRAVALLNIEYDVISFSGHTIYHGPSLGRNDFGTLQIGEISLLVASSGKTAVSDYRTTDMSHGGLGAPLIALSDYIIFGNSDIMTLNIGGIANMTYLGKEGTIAFDTGPGNMLIDQAMNHFFGLSMDKDGRVARTGDIDDKFLTYLMKDAYLKRPLPKNSGREYYGSLCLTNLFKKFPKLKKEDFIRTLTRFTAASIYDQAKRFLPALPSELVVGGGGSRNKVLMSDLKTLFEGRVETFKDKGINDEFREALGFAILANQTIHHAAGRIVDPKIMSGPVLGKITPGNNFKELFRLIN